MRVVFVGRVPERYVEVLKRFGFEISETPPLESSDIVVFYEDCETARKMGYSCFTKEEFEDFINFLFSTPSPM
ncbi:hypothetical protein [Pyrobaculum islandicum]|uniref:hypothetical protein n=1 Tax=Pyrobaculum islandicum TaxID=2277 RepID=UPI00069F30ED|nr:hypothetical protein [Pyrobaculum islandicum]